MRCPKCKYKSSKVFDVRKYLTFVLRSRRCFRCRHEWKTQECEIPFDKFLKESFDSELNRKSKHHVEQNNNLFDQ